MSRGWIRRLWPFLMAHRRDVIIAFGMAVLGQAVAAFTPLIQKVIIDDVIVDADRPLAPWLALLVAGRRVVGFGAAYVRRFVGGRVSLDVQYDLRNAIYEHLQRLDFAAPRRAADRPARVAGPSSDVALIQGLLAFLPIMRRQRRAVRRVARASCSSCRRC